MFSKMKQLDWTTSQGHVNAKNDDGENTVRLPLQRLSALFAFAVIVCYSAPQNLETGKE